MTPIRLAQMSLFGALVLVGGCIVSPGAGEASRFSDTINQHVKSWSVDSIAFGRLIRVERNPSRLRADLDRLAVKIRDLDAKARAMSVPKGEEARELFDAFYTYVTDQERMVTRDFEELIAILGSPTPDLTRFREILARCQQVENADLERLHQAEAAYSKATGTAPVVGAK